MRKIAILAAFACCLLAGCVSLPEISPRLRNADPDAVRIEGPDGLYSRQQTVAILDRLGQGGAASSGLLGRHIALETEAVGRPLVAGNRVTLLQDGRATYKSMFEAIRGARDHINLETYIFDDDEVGKEFAALLLKKRAAGVAVNVIYDGVGGIGTPKAFFEELKAGGIRVSEFNPVNPLTAKRGWRINHRDHRKLLVVDGRIAFVGGINISSVYSSGSRAARPDPAKIKESNWRDTHVRIEGPVVREFQRLFVETWQEVNGEAPPPANYFPVLKAAGDDVVHALSSHADDSDSPIYATLVSAVESATQRIYVTVAYFVPDARTLEVLAQAAQRGVDVRLILPGHSDFWAPLHAGRSHYAGLIQAGVRIYERRSRLLHSKTVVIDGVWSSVGSANWDPRSFLHNNELNAVILGRGFASQMEEMFQRDLANSDSIDAERWGQRSPIERAKEGMARIWEYWL